MDKIKIPTTSMYNKKYHAICYRILMNSFTLALLTVIGLSACSTKQQRPVEYIFVNKPATVPQGAEKKCWLEPRASYEDRHAGLNADKTFYVAEHVAVREVKQGRWVSCAELDKH